VKATNTELRHINRLMGYRDAQRYIKDTWIGFSTRKIAKEAVVRCTFIASWIKLTIYYQWEAIDRL